MSTPIDPLYASQWHFPMLGGIEAIWSEFDGAGVHVGVYDNAAEIDHPDLDPNYVDTFHFVDSGGTVYAPTLSSPPVAHATAVAGLIGAARGTPEGGDGPIGGVGVSYGASLTNVDFVVEIQNTYTDPDLKNALMAEAIRHAASFDVMNNSWGEFAGYGYLSSLLTLEVDPDPAGSLADSTSRSSLFHDAYAEIANTGRNGLGTVIVQSAGNDSSSASGYGLNASRFSITVSGTDQLGEATFFSNWGPSVLIAAPEASVTTDLTLRSGLNGIAENEDYTNLFGGTSASAPIVSGVVALMLEAAPDLGWRDVQNILAYSAALTGTPYGEGPRGVERSDWAGNGTDFHNGGALSFHYNYGFGMVDAYAAVRMAEVWTRMTGEAETSGNDGNELHASESYDGAPVEIPDADGSGNYVEIALNVEDNISIEHIEVTISASHDTAQNTLWSLIAPDGTELPFLLNEGVQYFDLLNFFAQYDALMENGFTWTFGITAFLGVESSGTWKLRVQDSGADGPDGRVVDQITDFTLDFYGSAPTDDTIHTFTNDFAEQQAVEADRNTIEDDAGNDWLNLVALKGDVTLDLLVGGFSENGVPWASEGAGTQIENAALGDGNDWAQGDNAVNEFLGGRGNDFLKGLGGDDVLEGGQGNDTLAGDFGHDQLIGGDGNDTFWGGKGNDTLLGGAGDDVIRANGKKDRVEGGEGNDHIEGGWGRDKLFGNMGDDTVLGGHGNDKVVGGGGSDLLDGGADNDRLEGRNGSDTLFGGTGDDVMIGGMLADEFRFVTSDAANTDTILDFALGEDRLALSDLGYSIAADASRTELTWATGHRLIVEGVTDTAALELDIIPLVV